MQRSLLENKNKNTRIASVRHEEEKKNLICQYPNPTTTSRLRSKVKRIGLYAREIWGWGHASKHSGTIHTKVTDNLK